LSDGIAVIDAWRALARHGQDCRECEVGVAQLRLVPDDPGPVHELLCEVGRALFEAWLAARSERAGELGELARPWGIPSAREDPYGAEERAAALTALPGPAAQAIYREPDLEKREAMIRAVVAAHRAGGVQAPEPAGEERECAREGCRNRFVVRADRRRQRYCSERCRKESGRRVVPLFGTEE
jgi:hypothetical protein